MLIGAPRSMLLYHVNSMTYWRCVCREHKLTWCPIYKAASTTWMYNLCLLAGYTEEYIAENHKQLNQLARDAFPVLDGNEAEQVRTQLLSRLKFCMWEYF